MTKAKTKTPPQSETLGSHFLTYSKREFELFIRVGRLKLRHKSKF